MQTLPAIQVKLNKYQTIGSFQVKQSETYTKQTDTFSLQCAHTRTHTHTVSCICAEQFQSKNSRGNQRGTPVFSEKRQPFRIIQRVFLFPKTKQEISCKTIFRRKYYRNASHSHTPSDRQLRVKTYNSSTRTIFGVYFIG